MRTYLVFEPAGAARDSNSADAVRFVREKFYWAALIVAPLWLIRHRLWLALLAWLAAVALIGGAGYALDLDPSVTSVALLLPSLVVAFEGSELRRRKLLRAGFRDAGAAIGNDLEDAERRFFDAWTRRPPERAIPDAPARPPAAPAPPSAPRSVIGLFPQAGGGR